MTRFPIRRRQGNGSDQRDRERALDAGLRGVATLRHLDERLGEDPIRSGTAAMSKILTALRDQTVLVPMFGTFSSGKSTLLGSLVGVPGLLPHRPDPTTAVFTSVRRGPRREAILSFARARVLGPLRDLPPEQEVRTLELIAELLDDPLRPLEAIEFKSSGGWARLSEHLLRDRIATLETLGGTRNGAGRSPWSELRVTLKHKGPVTLSLSTERGRAEFEGWTARGGRALWVEEVDVTVPTERLDGLMLVDTPGIDSLVQEHRAVTREAIRTGHAILFLASSQNTDVHDDDRRALRQLHEWLARHPDRIFHVATFADLSFDSVVDDVLDEVAGADNARVTQWMRDALTRGLRGAIGGRRSRRRPLADGIYLVDGQDLGAPRFDGESLWADLREYLRETQGLPLFRKSSRLLSDGMERREVALRALLRDGREDLGPLRERVETARNVVAGIEGDLTPLMIRTANTEIRSTIGEVRRWTGSLTSKPALREFGGKWQEKLLQLDSRLMRKLQGHLDSIEADVNDLLDVEEAKFRIGSVDHAGLAPRMGHVTEPLESVGWYLKGFIDFWGANTRKSNIELARSRALRELGRLEDAVLGANLARIEEAMKQASAHVEGVQATLDAGLKALEAAGERESFLREIEAETSILAESRQRLTRLAARPREVLGHVSYSKRSS